MVTKLWRPQKDLLLPRLPSYVKLDMAFGVGAGTKLFDKSRYRSHGTISGADWAAGVHGYCLDFVAASKDYVEIPAAYDQLDFTSEDFSIIARLKADSLATAPAIYCRHEFGKYGVFFYLPGTGRLQVYTASTGADVTTYSAVSEISLATWYTVGLSRSGASIALYKNGVALSVTSDDHTTITTCPNSAKIGIGDDKATYAFDGKMEFVRVLGGLALSASEHLAFHNALK